MAEKRKITEKDVLKIAGFLTLSTGAINLFLSLGSGGEIGWIPIFFTLFAGAFCLFIGYQR